jgi:kumamolisin
MPAFWVFVASVARTVFPRMAVLVRSLSDGSCDFRESCWKAWRVSWLWSRQSVHQILSLFFCLLILFVSIFRHRMPRAMFTPAGTIAIITAFHHHDSLSDFNNFSRHYGLPVELSRHEERASNLVFQQLALNADGTEMFNPITPNNNSVSDEEFLWMRQAALDAQWAHAIAPRAKILLLEAPSSDATAMLNAADAALRYPGVHVVCMGWGANENEFSDAELALGESIFSKTGAIFIAALGDNVNVSYPSTSPNVISVGGTSLFLSPDRQVMEAAFVYSVGGVSGKFNRPIYQNILRDIAGRRRVVPDVALVANPATGVNAYFKLLEADGRDGWFGAGGTSLSAHIFGAMVNLAGTFRRDFANSTAEELISMYHSMRIPVTASRNRRRDITFGSAGQFKATTGWDPVSGLGAPLGVGFDMPFIRHNTSKHFHRRRNDKISNFPF